MNDLVTQYLQSASEDIEDFKMKISPGGFLRIACLCHLQGIFNIKTADEAEKIIDEFVNN